MKRGARRRRRRVRWTPQCVASAATLTVIALFAAILVGTNPDVPMPRATPRAFLDDHEPATHPDRPAYRYSVIPRGAYSGEELREALSIDGIAAGHHRAVVLDAVRVETLTAPRQVYMSYRVGDDIAWTKHKVLLPAGETILTDGVNEIRARCGNGVSDVPREPTRDREPEPLAFDEVDDPATYAVNRPAPLGFAPLLTGGAPPVLPFSDFPPDGAGVPGDSDPFARDLIPLGGLMSLDGAGPRPGEGFDEAEAFLIDQPILIDPPIDGLDEIDLDLEVLDPDHTEVPSGVSDDPILVVSTPELFFEYPGLFGPPTTTTDPVHDQDPLEGNQIPAVPEPGTIFLLGAGISAAIARGLYTRRRG